MSEHNSPSDLRDLPEDRLPWERQASESGGAWAAFTRYRDMLPGERSLITAYRQETGRNQASQPSGQWTGWYQSNQWKHRAEAYDAHKDRIAREASEREHITALTNFRDRQRRLSAAATEAAITLLQLANKRLKEPDLEKDIKVGALPSFVRAAALAASAATAAEAEALGIDELVKQLDELDQQSGDGGEEEG